MMHGNSGFASGLLAAFLLSAGFLGAGWQIQKGMVESKNVQRRVTVKGLAERDVKADLALWTIRFTASGNDLAGVQETLDQDLQKIRSFLQTQGFDQAEIQPGGLRVEDLKRYSEQAERDRYAIVQTVTVRSHNVDLVADVSRRLGVLVRQGIVLHQDWESRDPVYVFTGLNEIKPAMIAEATQKAREAAVQFSQDSGSLIGRINTAHQGVFVILPRDPVVGEKESTQIFKTVRVVNTITYQLED